MQPSYRSRQIQYLQVVILVLETPVVQRKSSRSEDEYSTSDEYDSEDDSVPSEQNLDSDYSDEVETYETVTNKNLRAVQLANFFLLEKAEETIEIVLEIRNVLNISGDFSTLEKLQVRCILYLSVF